MSFRVTSSLSFSPQRNNEANAVDKSIILLSYFLNLFLLCLASVSFVLPLALRPLSHISYSAWQSDQYGGHSSLKSVWLWVCESIYLVSLPSNYLCAMASIYKHSSSLSRTPAGAGLAPLWTSRIKPKGTGISSLRFNFPSRSIRLHPLSPFLLFFSLSLSHDSTYHAHKHAKAGQRRPPHKNNYSLRAASSTASLISKNITQQTQQSHICCTQ